MELFGKPNSQKSKRDLRNHSLTDFKTQPLSLGEGTRPMDTGFHQIKPDQIFKCIKEMNYPLVSDKLSQARYPFGTDGQTCYSKLV